MRSIIVVMLITISIAAVCLSVFVMRWPSSNRSGNTTVASSEFTPLNQPINQLRTTDTENKNQANIIPICHQLEIFINKSLPVSARIPDNIIQLLPSVKSDYEISLVCYVVNDTTDSDAVRNEAIDLLRRSGYLETTNLLMTRLRDENERERFQSFCMQHLGLIAASNHSESSRISECLVNYLSDPRRSLRREALFELARLDDYRAIALLRTGLSDPLWNDSRDIIIRCMYLKNMKDQIDSIRLVEYTDDVSARIAAIFVLSNWDDKLSIPAFKEAMGSHITRLQQAGECALARINETNAQRSASERVDPQSP